jgi:ABC-type uncharacterized transport system permease subunit
MKGVLLIDVVLVGLGAMFGTISAGLSADSANQYINPHYLFWLRITAAAGAATCTTVVGYLKAQAAATKPPAP